jgi:glycosyltransferase involved in cell wall biosynthesis
VAAVGPQEMLPTISIVTPSFNQAKFVGATIDSVLSQRYPKLDYLVQDALSNDGSAQVLASFANNDQVQVNFEADRGQADGINKGFARANGEILAYLNSDDVLLLGALLTVGRYFRDHPDVDVVYGDRLLIDENGLQIGRWALPYHDTEVLKLVDYVPQETMFWRRSLFERVGSSMNIEFQFALDWELILRFMDHEARFAHLPRMLGGFRVHSLQKTSAVFKTKGRAEIGKLRAHYLASWQARLAIRPRLWKYLACHWWVEHVRDNRCLSTNN